MKLIRRSERLLSLPDSKYPINRRPANTSAQTSFIQSRNFHGNALQQDLSTVEHNLGCRSSQSKALVDALQLFDELSNCNVVSTTSLLGQLAKRNHHKEAFSFFSVMLERNIKPNEFTFGTLIHSTVVLKDLDLGKQLHGCAMKTGLTSSVFVGSAFLDFYLKLGNIKGAEQVFEETDVPNGFTYSSLIHGYLRVGRFNAAVRLFDRIPGRDVVSWNAMISGCSQTGNNEEAVNLFVHMLREGVVPDEFTFPCAIISAANIAALGMGRSFHACALKFLGELGVFIGNSLVSFYAKCGSMEDSLLAFSKLHEKSIVSWNAVICGYAQNGKGKEAIEMFQEMKTSGMRPNSVSLIGLLQACNHAGLVDEGCSYFNDARLEYPSLLKPEHYACVMDLLSRSGRFQEAEKFIDNLPFDPGIGFWKAILGGCRIHSNMKLGEFAARKILALGPADVSSYVMLSNAHSAARSWENVSAIRHEMRAKGLNRIPGCSWIQVKSQIHVFVTGDHKHVQKDEIREVLSFFLEHVIQSQGTDFSCRIVSSS